MARRMMEKNTVNTEDDKSHFSKQKKNLELQPFFPQIKKRNKKNWPWPWEPKNEKNEGYLL